MTNEKKSINDYWFTITNSYSTILKRGGTISAAQGVGRAIAERAQAAGVSQVVFDRGGYVYHGRVKALLDATREAGLNKNENASEANNPSATESTSDTIASAIFYVYRFLRHYLSSPYFLI